MDPELRKYLEGMEQRLASKADLAATRRDLMDQVEASIQAADQETRRVLTDAIQAADQESRRVLRAEIQALDAKLDATARDLRQGHADIIARLDAGFASRKEDNTAAFRVIRAVTGRVARLERRVTRLEAAKPPTP